MSALCSVFVQQPDGRWEFLVRTDIPMQEVLDLLDHNVTEMTDSLKALRLAMAARLREITGMPAGTLIADYRVYPYGKGPFPLTPDALREVASGRAKLVTGL